MKTHPSSTCCSETFHLQRSFASMELTQFQTILNEEAKRFELNIDGHVARIEYILNNHGTMFLTHTEVPTQLEGKGVGKKIVEDALQYLQDNNLKLAPLCPFVAAYLKRHPEHASLLAPGYNIS